MEKFLSIPVTSEGNQLVSCTGIKSIKSASATGTATIIIYDGGKSTTFTHAAQAAFSFRTAVQNAVTAALRTPWTTTVVDFTPALAVSAIVTA